MKDTETPFVDVYEEGFGSGYSQAMQEMQELIEVAYQVAKAQTNMKDPTGAIHRLKIVLSKLDQAREG